MVLIAISLVALKISYNIRTLKKELITLRQKKASYQPMLDEIEKLKNDKRILETKLTIINNLIKGTQITVRLLDEVASITPPNRMWLKSIDYNNNKMQIQGVALDNATIARYMNSLNNSDYLENSELKNSSQITVATKNLQSFDIDVNVQGISDEAKNENKTQKIKK